mgnify:CR=1 FL=1
MERRLVLEHLRFVFVFAVYNENFYKIKNALNEKFFKGRDKSNSQLYKIAGNSIVKRVLVENFKSLFKEYI